MVMKDNQKKQKNILHVVNIFYVLPYFFGNQLKYFSDLGYGLHIACSPSPNLAAFAAQQHISYIEVPIRRAYSLVADIKAMLALAKYIRRNEIDIVAGHTPKGALLSMIVAMVLRVPKRIYFRHGLMYETSVGIKRWMLMQAERLTAFCASQIVCVSPSVYDRSLLDSLNSASKQLVLGLGTCTGIDTLNKFNRETLDPLKLKFYREKYGIGEGELVLGFTGRMAKDKGILFLLNAFLSLRKTMPIRLLFVGDIDERDPLDQASVNIIHEHPDIIKTGFITDDIEYMYAMMTIFVLPSYREGFPTSILEASSMKLPVITTRVTGCIDAVLEDVTGCFVDHDSIQIAKCIEQFIDDKELLSKFGRQGREFAVNNFDNQVVWPILLRDIYS